jgi:methylthioribose-1-phosphate isomerase
MTIKAVEWRGDSVRILDQTRLPHETGFIDLTDYRDLALAIRQMKVRGAPAIGIAAAYGIALGAQSIKTSDKDEFIVQLEQIMQALAQTRPTAVNLFWAVSRMRQAATGRSVPEATRALLHEAKRIHQEEIDATKRLSLLGADLIEDGFRVLTHCNAGLLATAGYGTALGVIRAAKAQGKNISVFATETRPLFQGARLTLWELREEHIPATLITDSMAGYFMNRKELDCVIVGADRIAANGDVANKIGTYTIAVLAKENCIPFYVAAPTSTIDVSLPSGTAIPIEERDSHELTHFHGFPVAPEDTEAANPAFDVTPHDYVSAIITERGIIQKEYVKEIAGLGRS